MGREEQMIIGWGDVDNNRGEETQALIYIKYTILSPVLSFGMYVNTRSFGTKVFDKKGTSSTLAVL